MSWPLRLVTLRDRESGRWRVGDMAYSSELLMRRFILISGIQYDRISPNYDPKRRPPLVILLPGNVEFFVDEVGRCSGIPHGSGWTLSGVVPTVSITPIVISPRYRGLIENGVIHDDIDGRTYSRDGRRMLTGPAIDQA